MNKLEKKMLFMDEKVNVAKERKRQIQKERGKIKRTKPRTGERIQYAHDKNGAIIYIAYAKKRGSGYYWCPKCKQTLTARAFFSRHKAKHYGHTKKSENVDCEWRTGGKDDGSIRWTTAERQRKRKILDRHV